MDTPGMMDAGLGVMRVIKRSGDVEDIKFDKITQRIRSLAVEPPVLRVDPTLVTKKVIAQLTDGVSTSQLDEQAAEVSAAMALEHPDYVQLAGRIAVSNHQKNTMPSMFKTVKLLYEAQTLNGESRPIVSRELWDTVKKHKREIEDTIDHSRDFKYDYFGFQTLKRAYLLKHQGKVVERIQHMWMRVSLALYPSDMESAFLSYNKMSMKEFTHATPTLYNAGTPRQQLSSCFTSDTIVTTVNRGPIPIKHVRVGDMVTTHTGKVQKVSQLHINAIGDRRLISLDVHKSPPLRVTDNHKMWSIKKLHSGYSDRPEWTSVEDLQPGDAIAIPNKRDDTPDDREPYLYDKTHCMLNDLSGADNNFCRLIGIFIGNGSIIADKMTSGKPFIEGIEFQIPTNNPEMKHFLVKFKSDLLYLPPCRVQSDDLQCCRISFHAHSIGGTFEDLFGRRQPFNGKRVHPSMFAWSRDQVANFLAGLLSTNFSMEKNGSFTVDMHDARLCQEIFFLARQNGFDVSYAEPSTRKNSTPEHVQFNIPRDKYILDNAFLTNRDHIDQSTENLVDDDFVKQIDGDIFLAIRGKTLVGQEDTPRSVYTLGVENDHSYNVGGLVCENCFLLQMSDSIDGMMHCMNQCAQISKWAGGIGIHVHDVRCKNSPIYGTNGVSNGLVPLLRTFNSLARWIDQCLTADNLVFTIDGLKPVDSIQIGDRLLCQDGDYHPVQRVLQHDYDGDIYEIKTESGTLSCTPTQQIQIARDILGGDSFDAADVRRVSAEDMSDCFKLVGVTSNLVNDVDCWGLEDCFVFGLLLTAEHKMRDGHWLRLDAHDPIQNRLESYLTSRAIAFKSSTMDSGAKTYSWTPCTQFPFTLNMTTALPRAAIHLPEDKKQAILDGIDSQRTRPSAEFISHKELFLKSGGLPKKFPLLATGIAKEKYTGFVYDFVLEGASCYMTAAGLVHQADVDE